MSQMVYTFANIYTKVAEYLGLGSSPTGTDLTRVKDLTYRGYVSFLMPFNAETNETYVWEFLKKETTLTLATDQWEYPLPDDFHKLTRLPQYAEETHYPPIKKTSVGRVMYLRNGTGYGSYPFICAVRSRNFNAGQTPQGKDIIFYPTPQSTLVLNFSYMFIPDKPTNDGDYFVGGPLESEAILESCLAAAEFDQDEKEGIHAKMANKLVQQLILSDQQSAPDTVGTLTDTNIGTMSIRARPFDIIESQTSVFGYDL